MTLPTDLRPLPGLLISAVSLVMVLMTLPASALGPETCFSRQHQGTAVIVRQALNRQAVAMIARTVHSERDCVLACCSEEVLTDPDLQPGHTHLNSSSSRGKVVVAAQGALKGGVVAFMVLGLAVLTLALAVGGRKAMESFDRRHYTRLELNDLHYEI
ncbi:hypothetical protein GOODEAATRI_018391 [Goodea atripinnis]|uniref:Uncharacterized protein n=1 Tax=Goodea atripinnis TaxID=208336 RepID=A0ABV0MT52_9TELE